MKALVLRKADDLEVLDVPDPRPGPGQVLVRVDKCGICGSDLRYYRGENPWAKQTLGVELDNPPNMILGHEFAGEVIDAADGLEGRVGERVVVLAFRGCGRCRYCRRGMENLCADTIHYGHGAGWGEMDFYPGGMAQYCAVFSELACPLPDEISFEEATLLDGLAVAIRAAHRAALRPAEDVAIFGSGAIGLLILQVSRVFGARRVVCVDISDGALAVASEMGADAVINSAEADARDGIMASTGGYGADVVFDTVGSSDTVDAALSSLSRGGRLVLMATKGDRFSFPTSLISGERSISTSANALYRDFQMAIDLTSSGRVSLKRMITHVVPLTRAKDAFDIALNKSEHRAIKVLIDCLA